MERRVGRYKVIYIYKMLHGYVLDIGLIIKESPNTRSGSSIYPSKTTANRAGIKTKQTNSILNYGVRIFNALPVEIREIGDDLSKFKQELDKYLARIPDQPAVPGLVPGSHDLYGKPSNSIIDLIQIDNIQYITSNDSLYADIEYDQCDLDIGNADIGVF